MEQSSPADSGGADRADEAPVEEAGRAARKADAFMDLINAGLHAADRGHAAGDDRYLVHLVCRDAGHCRFPGCQYSRYDIHHVQWWEGGGPSRHDPALAWSGA